MSITLAQAKAHLRVTHSDEDALITQYLNAATAWVERYTAKLLAEGEVTEMFTEFGDYIEPSLGPFVALTSIVYGEDPDEVTLEGARVRKGRIYPPSAGWPTLPDYSTVYVTYGAGYTTTPPELDAAVLLLVGHMYLHREGVIPTSAAGEQPFAWEALAGPFRIPTLR